MRPVTRGVPAAYSADYLNDPHANVDVVDSVRTSQGYIDQIDTLRQRIAGIESKVIERGGEITSSKKRRTDPSPYLRDLVAAQPSLDLAYSGALRNANVNVLENAAQDLIENLNAQITWYNKNTDPYKNRAKSVYVLARGDLIQNIGQYCSYCEIPLAANLAVEHMLPKADFPLVALSWTNFLLACSKCNSYKKAKPSRETGKQVAQKQGANPPLSTDVISAAALSTYVWPSDNAGYRDWQSFYRFRMKKVLYGNDGRLLSSIDIPDPVVTSWFSGSTRVTVLSESGYAINASYAELLREIRDNTAATILQGLGTNTINQPLQDALTTLPLDYRLNFVDARPQLALVNNNTWRISEIRQYKVDTAYQPGPTLSEGNRQIVTIPLPSKSAQTAFLAALHRGDIPWEIAHFLSAPGYQVNPLVQQVKVTAPDLVTYLITVIQTIYILVGAGVVRVYSPQQSQVELHLEPVGGAGAARAQQVIDDLQLNHIDPEDEKFSDRRVVKRTKTWFVALEAARNWDEVVRFLGINSPLATDLANLVTQMAIATGYWSVWWSVFHNFLAPAIRDPLTNFLASAQNFPGVR